MKFCINDFDIYYEKHGNSKQSILILPGWGDTRNTFIHLIDFLKKQFTIYILDYPGFGKSPFPNRDLTIDDYALLISNFIYANNIDKPIIIGHSFGGRIGTLLATKYKTRLKKIILMDSAGIKPKKSIIKILKQTTYKTLKKLAYLLPKKIKTKYLDKLINIFGSTDFKNLNPNIRKSFINIVNTDLTKYIKQIKCDTLLIWGEKDLDTPLKDAYKFNKLINDSGLVIIKNSEHFPYLDNPNYINKIIYEFIKTFATQKDE